MEAAAIRSSCLLMLLTPAVQAHSGPGICAIGFCRLLQQVSYRPLLEMPRKKFQDGRIATKAEAEKISKGWDSYDGLRERGLGGRSLLLDQHGKKYVLPNLGNMSFNADVLLEISYDMKRRSRLSSDPIEVLLPMIPVAVYICRKSAPEASSPGNEVFEPGNTPTNQMPALLLI